MRIARSTILCSLAAAAVLLAGCTYNAAPASRPLPPGLAKKQHVPPGHAKKRGYGRGHGHDHRDGKSVSVDVGVDF
jgi:hypothetical protein